MAKTIRLKADEWGFDTTGVKIDLQTSGFVIAPKVFGSTGVSSVSNTNPLAVKSVSSYDDFNFIYHGKIAVDRVGTVTESGGMFSANYLETVNTEKTTVTSIVATEGPSLSIFFGQSISYNKIAGKKIGAMVENGDKIIGTGYGDNIATTNKAEIVAGGAGDDVINGRGGNDTLKGESGNDRVLAGTGNDRVEGALGNDTLKGEAGNDTLYGGSDADKLVGGSGADVFLFKTAKESTATRQDIVYDFTRSQGDKIDLEGIDADTKVGGGDQAFSFIVEKDFTKKAGQLRYENKSGDTFLQGDVNGDGKTDFSLRFDATIDFVKGDFIL